MNRFAVKEIKQQQQAGLSSEVETHLAEKRSKAVIAGLDELICHEIHIEGGSELSDAFLPQHLQRLLKLGQCVDADGHAGQGVDYVGFHRPFRQHNSGSGQSC